MYKEHAGGAAVADIIRKLALGSEDAKRGISLAQVAGWVHPILDKVRTATSQTGTAPSRHGLDFFLLLCLETGRGHVQGLVPAGDD